MECLTQSTIWISLLVKCALFLFFFFQRPMGISTSTLSVALTFLPRVATALDRQIGVTVLCCFFGLLNPCRAAFSWDGTRLTLVVSKRTQKVPHHDGADASTVHVTDEQQDTRSVFTKVFACTWRQELTINSREEDV